MSKISIIGAGSAVFSLGLVRDLCLTPNLSGSTVNLMDVNEGRLAAISALCRRYAAETGAKLTIEATTDRRESLRDANFVVNTALAAGHDRLRAGWAIARRHGYRFGGSLHVMHDEAFWINFYQLQLMDEIVRDIEEVCPDAWYLLVANPVLAGVTLLKRRYPELRLVGLCHGYGGVYQIIDALGFDRTDVTYELPGVNHFIWLTKFLHKGENAFPTLDRWIAEKAEAAYRADRPSDGMGPKAIDLYRRFGAFPIGDTCTPGGGSWPFWHHVDDDTETRFGEDPNAWWEAHFTAGERTTEGIRRVVDDSRASVVAAYPAKHSGETMIPLVESIACDIPRVQIVNVLNDGGYVPGVPRDFSVEIPALVSGKGVQGIHTDGLPPLVLSHLLRDRVAPVNAEITAFAGGDREALRSMLLMDPFTRSFDQAERLLDDLLAMPAHEEMRRHFS